MDRNYVVYVHKDVENRVRYVGSGRLIRALKCHPKSRRGKLYSDFVEKFGKLAPEILYSNLCKRESLLQEIDLYNKYIGTGLLLNMGTPSTPVTYPTRDELQKILQYDKNSPSGFIWKSTHDCRLNNRVKNRNFAGHIKKSEIPYWVLKINRQSYYIHRLVMIVHGIDIPPDSVIDHIDGNSLNNSLENLRVCTQAENTRNKRRGNFSSKYGTGVSLATCCNKFAAKVSLPREDTVDGESLTRTFSISKYGFDKALALAIQARENLLDHLENSYGVSYSEKHRIK